MANIRDVIESVRKLARPGESVDEDEAMRRLRLLIAALRGADLDATVRAQIIAEAQGVV